MRFTSHAQRLRIDVNGRLAKSDEARLFAMAQRIFRLDDDLAPFYEAIADDPRIAWARCGAGRMLASVNVFDDVIRTICTTNCAWSATERMIGALVQLGEGAFPLAEQLARTPERWFSDVARMGYRGPYVREIARLVTTSAIDMESWLPHRGAGAEVVEEALLELPGVGPYAASHVMLLLGYHERMILDSWTRPTYARKTGKKHVSDTTIRRAFKRYGRFAGLAFWLFLTAHWHDNYAAKQGDGIST